MMSFSILLVLISFNHVFICGSTSDTLFNFVTVEDVLTIVNVGDVISDVVTNFTDEKISNSKCFDHVKLFGESLANGDDWAIRMFDANAKPQSGFLEGNIMQIGNFDECLKIKSSNGVEGRYCTALFFPHQKYGQELNDLLKEMIPTGNTKYEESQVVIDWKTSYGFCLPKSCSAEDLLTLFNETEEILQSPLHFHFTDEFCSDRDGIPFETSAIVAIIIFSAFGLLIACSTIYDIFYFQKLNEKQPHLYVAFSALTNVKRLLSTRTADGTLNCLNGIRVISMMWIVLIHRFMYSFFLPTMNGAYIFQWRNNTGNAFIVAGPYAVDTFFVVSGLLVVYLFMMHREKGIKFSLPMFYLHRILRLTPSLAMVVYLSATLIKYMGDGPFWVVLEELFQKPCEKNWWSTLMYLNNYLNTDDSCVGQSWYLAADTQMYFLSPFVLYPLTKWPKQTLGTIVVFLILNCSYVFEITFKKQLAATFFDQDTTYFDYIYRPTHVRCVSYLVGMICGYYIFLTRSKPLKLSKLTIFCLWTFSLSVLLTIVLAHAYFLRSEYTLLEASFFNSVSKIGWTGALSIMIVLCVNGYGGLIDSFLSSKIFTVLIRLNYNIYLLHGLLMAFVAAQERTTSYFSNLNAFHSFWGDYMLSVAAAFVWTLAFESPVLVLEKIIFGRKTKPGNIIPK